MSTKTDTVVEKLSRRLRAGEWVVNESLPPISLLASEFGVSQGTVSLALRNLQTSALVEILPRKGVRVTANTNGHSNGWFRGNKHPTIGLCGSYVPKQRMSALQIGGNSLIHALWTAIHENGSPVILMPDSTRKKPLTTEYCTDHRVQGVIFLGGETHAEAEILRSTGFPVLLANHPAANSPLNYVDYDHASCLREILRRFLDAGHQRIAVMSMMTSVPDFFQRFQSVFVEELNAAGILCRLHEDWRIVRDYATEQEYADAIVRELDALLAQPDPPTAIFAWSPSMIPTIQARLRPISPPVSLACAGYDNEKDAPTSGFIADQKALARALCAGISAAIANPFHSCRTLLPLRFVDHQTINEHKKN